MCSYLDWLVCLAIARDDCAIDMLIEGKSDDEINCALLPPLPE